MNILALDLATHTGWATRIDGVYASGVELFDVGRNETPGMRYLKLSAFLRHKCLNDGLPGPVELIVFEQNLGRFAKGQAQADTAAKLIGTVETFCARYKIECTGFYPATIKKFATGNGRAKKNEVIAAVHKRWLCKTGCLCPLEKLDDNEADAIALLRLTISKYDKEAA